MQVQIYIGFSDQLIASYDILVPDLDSEGVHLVAVIVLSHRVVGLIFPSPVEGALGPASPVSIGLLELLVSNGSSDKGVIALVQDVLEHQISGAVHDDSAI